MNNKDFIAEVAQMNGMKTADVQQMMNSLYDAMGDSFMEGLPVQLPNFGTFEVKKRMERIMINPANGQRMLVPPKLTLSFKPSVLVKDKIRKGGKGNG